MNLGKLVVLSGRSIFRNRMRSLLTSLGIIIGVGSVIVMIAVGQGSQQQIAERIASMGTNLIMVMPPRGGPAANRLTLEDVQKLRLESGYLDSISGMVRQSISVVGGSGDWITTVIGVEPDYLAIKQWSMQSGAFFTDLESASRSKVAVLGTTVVQKLFARTDPIGKNLRIGTTPFLIVGVLASKGSDGGGNDQDDTIMIPLETDLTRVARNKYLNSILISAASPSLMTQAQVEIGQIMRDSHRLTGKEANDFDIMNQSEIIKTASQTSETLTTLLAAIAGVSLLVGGIGIMNIMLVSVTERTREIGIRMAVGARKKDILLQFLAESVILSLLGGLIGILLALAVAFGVSTFAGIPAIVNPLVVLISAGFAALVGVFFGLYPARKAANLYPIDALRFE